MTGLALQGYGHKNVPTVCLLATRWLYIWKARLNKKQIWLYKMRAEREAMVTVTILIKSRFQGGGGHDVGDDQL